jgi:hypothetical protein
MTKPELILNTAAELISGPRAEAHGDYRKLHQRVSQFWSAYLQKEVTPEQVALCLALVKVARDEVGNYNIDDGIDAVAYVSLWAALSNGSRPQDQEKKDIITNKDEQFFTEVCNWEEE